MHTLTSLLARVVITLTLSGQALAADYDLVILNGRVMDPETNFDAVRNVGIKDGKIVEITEEAIEGEDSIDAKGLVVSPGFIDGHVHVVDSPVAQKALLRDGVTSAMDLEVGAFPVDTWYDNLAGRSQTNYGANVSVASARVAAFNPKFREQTGKFKGKTGNLVEGLYGGMPIGDDWVKRVATDEERQLVLDLVEEGLKRGALGVGPPTGYMTEGFSSQEMLGVHKLAGKYGRLTHVHTRFSSQMSPTSGILAFQEAIASAEPYGAGVIVAHFTAQALALTEPAMEYVDDLRKQGTPVVLEVYPYTYGAAGNGVSADYLKPDNYQKNMGRTYKDIIDIKTGKSLDKATYDKLVKEDPNHPVMFGNAKEEDVLKAVAHPDVLIGCDCFPFTSSKTGKMMIDWDTPWEELNGHPRTAGAHAKVLRLTREKKLMPLMQAISKMSYQYAKFLEENGVSQMAFKGRMQTGADADITIFDPETVTDNSKLEQGKNGLPSTGIPYVLVNGTVVVKDSRVLKDVFPGKPIRAAIVK